MDGKNLLYRLRNIIDEDSGGDWMDDRTSYDFLWEAAKIFTARTQCLTAEQEFVTVANQANYVLDARFLKLYLMNRDNRYYIKYSYSSGDQFVFFRDYEDITFNNYTRTYDTSQGTLTTAATTLQDTGQDFSDWETTSGNATYKVTLTNTQGSEFWGYMGEASTTTNDDDTIPVYTDLALGSTGWNGGTPSGTASFYRVENVSSQTVPSFFTIKDKDSLYDQVTGTATSDGDATLGETTLTDTAATFFSSERVNPGDTVHNVTDTSDGMVLSITSDTAAKVALFGGTGDGWDTDDVYVIQPQGRIELVFDPPPSTSGHIVRVPYISSPAPVYSIYGAYRFRPHNMEAIVKYAAWLYKYRDSDPNFGDKWYGEFDRAVRRESKDLRPFVKKRKLNVNLKGR